ncbi:IS3 family transposase [Stenotrophomonas indicatrix]|uniref:IS3 family transposase n=1 Tax=Stenotrophomonas indicatrix TaxID=2045451 RepID=UPI00300B3687
MFSVQQGLKDDGVAVPLAKLCQWFGVARRTMYYKPTRSPATVKAELAEPIKELIEAEPSFGYRTVAALLGMNKNTVQRIFQLKDWQVRKRALGQRPRIEAKVSRAEGPDQRWATDLCRVWGGRDGWLSLALVIECSTRQLLGWHLPRTGKASTASAALEQALLTRFGTLGSVPEAFLLRSDNGLVFTSRDYTRLVRGYGLKREFITPHCPQQNGMVERVIRTLKEQCVHRHRSDSQVHAMRVIADWIVFCNQQRPHQR